MSYPKPLSQKTLNKLYEKAGFSVEVQDYLHKLFYSVRQSLWCHNRKKYGSCISRLTKVLSG